MGDISEKAVQLILNAEGLDQPDNWPGGASGITIGIGYDLGYTTVDRFESDWEDVLPASQLQRLKEVVGLRGVSAKVWAHEFSDIKINPEEAKKVFTERTLPIQRTKAQLAFPGFDKLPVDAQGALISLVYNRGTSMFDKPGEDRRKEMRAIRDAVAAGDLQEIANQIRSMERLWQGKGLDGLIKRREDEAALVESSIGAIA
ncbi:MAG TPA: pesticin C-terminus-like muramidase [Chitinophagaceae bacterium]|jgi:GH24 family phage-related lysozyme (muramidase)